MLLTSEGQMSNYNGAALMLHALPLAKLFSDRRYDSDDYRHTLLKRNIVPCIPPRKNR